MTIKGKKTARGAALHVLNRVTGGGAYAEIVLEREIEGLPGPERGLATELVYGVLRQLIRIDWVIDSFSKVRTGRMETTVLNALRIGVYQVYFLTRVPASAAVNETVRLIRPLGEKKAGFVNAVMRSAAAKRNSVAYPDVVKDPILHVSVVYSHPEWLVRRWAGRFGIEETIGVCKANLAPPQKTIRANTIVNSRDALIEELKGEGVEAVRTAYSPDGLEIKVGGRLGPDDPRFYIQDEASQLISYLLAPLSGETVLDACSAPGGKTTHMAALMGNRGLIYALDRRPGRLKTVEEAARRLKAGIIKTIEADSALPLGFSPPPGGFDAILCDAPCSGLGVLRRTPDIKLKRTEQDIIRLSLEQARILDNLAGYIKKGGRIVYSTCTFEPEETDGIISGFLSRRSDFVKEDAGGCLPEVCAELVDGSGFLRTYPHRHGMDGFFAARLKRV